ncbi:AraC family transcriptional regulator [Paenibacillus sp. YYML68]|uniref:helix-turn-helix transcriptional regulator n=1 Tax=Paenibacillus sp. YYML68 TaxID=2909250 RepID=UPI002490E980|nr:AraC family transcriptional regulator [Paenibacillus sp. YYML68]
MKMLELVIPPLPHFITVGHSWWKRGQVHFKRSWNIYDLIIVTNGALYITEDDQPYTISAGQMLLLEPSRTHWGHQSCEEDTETYFVHFSHPYPHRELDSSGFPWTSSLQPGCDLDPSPRGHSMYIPKYADVQVSDLIPVLNHMVEIRDHSFVQNVLELHSLAVKLFVELQHIIYRQKAMPRSLELCTKVTRYIEMNFNAPISARQLETEIHFNIDYITRCMKKHTGMTPLQYMQHIRIEHSKRKLATTMLSIQEIADHIGFERSSYFIRIFRGKEGMTPGQYRERMQRMNS